MIIPSIQSAEKPTLIVQPAAESSKTAPQPIAQNYYYSPALTIDPKTETAVLEYRNATTGAVTNQFPSQQNLDAYAKYQIPTSPDTTTTSSIAVSTQTVSTVSKDKSSTDSTSGESLVV